MTSNTDSSALVIFSGGQDSATCLGWALNRFDRVFTVGFDYGQRHHVEMECRRNVLNAVRSDALLSLGLFNQIGETAMTSDMEIAFNEQGIPNTFVPGRNLVFLTAAAALAWRKGIRHLVMGVCETDFSGYPDCRDDTVKAMQVALNLGMDARFVVHGQGPHMDPRRAGRRRAFCGVCPYRDAHLLYRGSRRAAPVGLRLRPVPRLQAARARMERVFGREMSESGRGRAPF